MYDPDNSSAAPREETTVYTDTGRTAILEKRIEYDNGQYFDATYDLLGTTKDFASQETTYLTRAMLIRLREATVFDAGNADRIGSTLKEWDYSTNIQWSEHEIRHGYDGARIYERIVYDAGDDRYSSLYEKDVTGTRPWLVHEIHLAGDKAHSRTYEYTQDEDLSAVEEWKDPLDRLNWSDRLRRFDTQGRVIEEQLDEDDGAVVHAVIRWVSGEVYWTRSVVDAQHRNGHFYKTDANGSVEKGWDYTATDIVDAWEIDRDAKGRKTSALTYYDKIDGYSGRSHKVDTWYKDSDGWKKKSILYNGNDELVSETVVANDGLGSLPFPDPTEKSAGVFSLSGLIDVAHPLSAIDPKTPFAVPPQEIVLERTIVSQHGDDLIGTSMGVDTFRFYGPFGHDVLTGFRPGAGTGDVLAFRKSTFANLKDVLSHATQQGADVLVTVDQRNSLLIKNTSLSGLKADDFSFAA
jgi:hypothetical protein